MHYYQSNPLIYSIFIILSLIIGLLIYKFLNYPKQQNGINIWHILPVFVIGAIIGAKLPVLFSYGLHIELLWTGKSYFGGILGAFIAINLFKKIYDIKGYFGDRFVIPLCVSVGIGKVGCFFYGCCGGLPTDFILKMRNHFDVYVHPVQLYEAIFQFLTAGLFFYFYKTRKYQGMFFLIYILMYMLFRFVIEFIRNEPRVWLNLSIYQWLSLAFIPYFLVILIKRVQNDSKLFQ